MTREEALARLDVRPQTLYAYVSRGRIERRADDFVWVAEPGPAAR